MISTDDAAEEAVLAACLQSVAARKEARRILDRDDFFHPTRIAMWDAMSQLDRDQQPVDLYSLKAATDGIRGGMDVLLRLVGHQAIPDNVATYANTVRGWAVRRRLWDEAMRVKQQAENVDIDPAGLASQVATRFAQLRDEGSIEDAQSITLGELLDSPDDEPDWIVPGLLERGDRFILTGAEGLGKSYLLRQIAIFAAAGLDPFDLSPIPPRKVLIVDCENSERQVKRKARAVVDLAQRLGTGRPEQVNLLCVGRIDILQDKYLATIHREIDTIQPDIIVIGPIYAMSPKALMTDDDAVPVLAALDTLRERGACLLMEAHAGHSVGEGGRNFRPRGSAALMGWPEFGYGLKPVSQGFADLVPWRGDRDSRNWPDRLKHDRDGIRWLINDHPDSQAPWSPTRGIA